MGRLILNVPKIKQLPRYCNPASVAMVLNYYNFAVTQLEVAQSLCRLGPGFRDQDILHYVRTLGLIVHPRSEASICDLVNLIDKKIPAIVRTMCLSAPDSAHLSVITGYDTDRNEFIFNDPSDLRRSLLPFRTLSSIWTVNNDQGYSSNYFISIHPR